MIFCTGMAPGQDYSLLCMSNFILLVLFRAMKVAILSDTDEEHLYGNVSFTP